MGHGLHSWNPFSPPMGWGLVPYRTFLTPWPLVPYTFPPPCELCIDWNFPQQQPIHRDNFICPRWSGNHTPEWLQNMCKSFSIPPWGLSGLSIITRVDLGLARGYRQGHRRIGIWILEEKALLLCLSYLFDLGWLKTIYLWWLLLSPRLPGPWCPDTGRNIIFSILMRLILKQLWFRKADYVPWWDRGLTQSGEGLFRRNTDFSQVRWNSPVWWAFNFKRFCLAFQFSGIWIYIPYNPGNQFLKIYHVNVCTHCLR